ncbi:MAG: GNAT family N-acetyltransferase [Verrucomicrobiota bacterium]
MPDPNALIIRAAEISSATTLIDFNCRLVQETEHLELDRSIVARGVENLLNHPARGFYLLAEQDGQVAGSLMVTFEWSDWRDANFWWIQSVYVRVEFRRRGVYRKLFEQVCKLARESNACGIRLYVEKENFVAQKTYTQLGMNESHYKIFEMELACGTRRVPENLDNS